MNKNIVTFSDGTPVKVSKSVIIGGSILITSPLMYLLDQVAHLNLALILVIFMFMGMAVANTAYRYFTGKDID